MTNVLLDLAARVEAASGAENSAEWRPIGSWEGQSTGQGHPVLLCVSDGGAHPPVVGEAWFDPDAYRGTWWWANLSQGDYHASPIIEMQHGVPTHWMPLPGPPASTLSPTPFARKVGAV